MPLELYVVPAVFAAPDATPVWWARDEDRTINGGTYKTLNTTIDSTSAYAAASNGGAGSESCNFTIKFGILFSNGASKTIRDGTADGTWSVQRTSNGNGQQNLTAYVCPTQTLNSTDSFWVQYWGYTPSMGWFQFGFTGSDSWSSDQLGYEYLNGTLTFSLYTYRLYVAVGTVTNLRLYVGTATYKTKVTGIQLYAAPATPTYSNLEPANYYITKNNESLSLKVKWDAGSGLTMSQARFSWNLTGSWSNSTYQALNGSSAQSMWFNISRTINSANNQGGFWVGFQFTANNTANNFNMTTVRYFYYWEIYPSTSKQELGSSADSGWTSNCYNALSTGGRAAQYVCYLNTSDEWVYAKAYDMINGNWTPNTKIVDMNSTDSGHYLPTMGFLPDGRAIVAWGYAVGIDDDPLSVRISTYDADTETNLTKLLSYWGSTIKISAAWANGAKGFSYPYIFNYGTNSTCIYARDGTNLFCDWEYLRWVSKGWADCYVKTYVEGEIHNFGTNGTTPYANEEQFNRILINSQDHGWMGNFTFRTQNTETDKEMYIETNYNHIHLRIYTSSSTPFGTYTPHLWNGTAWTTLSGLASHVAGAWDEWDVSNYLKTNAALGAAQVKFNLTSIVTGTFYFKWFNLRCNITGFAPAFTLLGNGTTFYGAWGASYLNFHKVAGQNKLFVSGEQYYSVSGEYYRRNAIAFFSNNSGYNWYKIDGTALGTGFSFQNRYSWAYNNTNPAIRDARYYPCYNANMGTFEINNVVWNYSLSKVSFRNELSYYNKTVGTSGGSWLVKNCTWANNSTYLFRETVPMQYYGYLYYDMYYKRPAFWNYWNTHLCLFVQSPYNISKWQIIYENTTYSYGRTWGRELHDSTMFYNTIVHTEILICGFYSSFGATATNASQGVAVACKFQATSSMAASGILWWVNPDASGTSGDLYADVALYSSSLNRLAYSGQYEIAQGAYLNWWSGASFTSSYSVTAGTWYYLCFRVTSSTSHIQYLYDANTTANQCYEKNIGTGTWPASLSGGTVQNREVNVVLIKTVRQVWGLGQDPRYPILVSQGYNTTVAGAVCKFYGYWTALALDDAILSTTNSGPWLNESTVDFASTPGWANKTITLNSTQALTIYYRWHAKSTNGLWTTTSTYSFQTKQQAKVPIDLPIHYGFGGGANGRIRILCSLPLDYAFDDSLSSSFGLCIPVSFSFSLSSLQNAAFSVISPVTMLFGFSSAEQAAYSVVSSVSMLFTFNLDLNVTAYVISQYFVDLTLPIVYSFSNVMHAAFSVNLESPMSFILYTVVPDVIRYHVPPSTPPVLPFPFKLPSLDIIILRFQDITGALDTFLFDQKVRSDFTVTVENKDLKEPINTTVAYKVEELNVTDYTIVLIRPHSTANVNFTCMLPFSVTESRDYNLTVSIMYINPETRKQETQITHQKLIVSPFLSTWWFLVGIIILAVSICAVAVALDSDRIIRRRIKKKVAGALEEPLQT